MEIRTIKEHEKEEVIKIIFETFNINYGASFDVVAILNKKIVGHAFLSTVTINDNNKLLALAPIAVKKEYQGQKIGTQLIEYLESKAAGKGYQEIFILGSPQYYSRFNYVPAISYEIKAPFEIEDKYFMVKELYPNSLDAVTVTLKYSPPFQV